MPELGDRAPGTDPDVYDVVVVGGGLSGAGLGVLLQRRLPQARVLIAERRTAFDRKVGEATVEISASFLHRTLGLWDHLSREHLPKHGLRYWFTDGPDRHLGEMSEVGPSEAPRLPSFQLDRSRLDEEVLARATAEGCEVVRGAKVAQIDLAAPETAEDGRGNRLVLDGPDGRRTVRARWVVDASGRQAYLARKQGLQEKIQEHPVSALWGRWRGVLDLDGPELTSPDHTRHPLPNVSASRRLGTNHFCGYGWWCWVIPLAGGETSIGLVYDRRLLDLGDEGTHRSRYEAFLRAQPGLRELVDGATVDGNDFLALRHLPYKTRRYMAPGWALVGDAAAFLDPYYSPGLDHAAISVFATAEILEQDLAATLRGEAPEPSALAATVEAHDRRFRRSIDRWFAALYQDKYEILGDAELVRTAFLLETGIYYLAVVTPVVRQPEALRDPVLGYDHLPARLAFRGMRLFNRRMRSLARLRRRTGVYGRRNLGWRRYSKSFAPGAASLIPMARGLASWLRLELGALLLYLRRGTSGEPQPRPRLEPAAKLAKPPAATSS